MEPSERIVAFRLQPCQWMKKSQYLLELVCFNRALHKFSNPLILYVTIMFQFSKQQNQLVERSVNIESLITINVICHLINEILLLFMSEFTFYVWAFPCSLIKLTNYIHYIHFYITICALCVFRSYCKDITQLLMMQVCILISLQIIMHFFVWSP